MGFIGQLKHAWSVFTDPNANLHRPDQYASGASGRPDRPVVRYGNERSIVTSIYTRIAVDFSLVDLMHVRKDDDGRYQETLKTSSLHECLTVSPNLDQTPSHFKRDLILSMFESQEGTIAVVPVETTVNPKLGSFDILNMRVGRVVQWHPQHVVVDLYNEKTGRHEQVPLYKTEVALIENPLSPVMNSPNSTLQRLIRKLALLDAIDEQSSSGKMDLIIQMPFPVRHESRRLQAEKRRKDIEFQLKDSQYGIAYIDSTEKVTQLNRAAENNLLKQVEFLTVMLYGQLGITEEIMNGTADEKVMLNYMNRTIEPLLDAFCEEFIRKFLTKTARTQGQTIMYFRDVFKLVPMSDMAEMADKFTRNEIFTSNEIRQFIGQRPSKDPKADELRNSNMPAPLDVATGAPPTPDVEDDVDLDMSSAFAEANQVIDQALVDLGVQE